MTRILKIVDVTGNFANLRTGFLKRFESFRTDNTVSDYTIGFLERFDRLLGDRSDNTIDTRSTKIISKFVKRGLKFLYFFASIAAFKRTCNLFDSFYKISNCIIGAGSYKSVKRFL